MHISPGNPFNSMTHVDLEATYTHLVRELNRFGVVYLSVVEIDLANPGDHTRANYGAGSNGVTRGLREIFDGAYITNGGYGRETGRTALSSGHAELVMYGRPFIANPDLVERLRKGAALNEVDESTVYARGEGVHGSCPP